MANDCSESAFSFFVNELTNYFTCQPQFLLLLLLPFPFPTSLLSSSHLLPHLLPESAPPPSPFRRRKASHGSQQCMEYQVDAGSSSSLLHEGWTRHPTIGIYSTESTQRSGRDPGSTPRDPTKDQAIKLSPRCRGSRMVPCRLPSMQVQCFCVPPNSGQCFPVMILTLLVIYSLLLFLQLDSWSTT